MGKKVVEVDPDKAQIVKVFRKLPVIPKGAKLVKQGILKRNDVIEFGYEIGGRISKMFIRVWRRPAKTEKRGK